MALLEVCCFTPESAVLAYEAGADRIELCINREAGGTTPPVEWLAEIQRHVRIPVFVMIRPRAGDFTYSSVEFDQMKRDINAFKPRADGFVFGILDGQAKVDVARMAELVQTAAPLPCTFHKAFDETPDLLEAFEDVLATGCSAILTSGGAASALAGVDTLGELVRKSQRRLTIMPGGSVRASNISRIRKLTGAGMIHTSGVPEGATGPSASEVRQMKTMLREKTAQEVRHLERLASAESQSSDRGGSCCPTC
ncbi:hypothetical protein LTS16_000799 [Friedmanniomyces endolithicus]|nr:hypothetical protein LTS00_001174 [Friedmanniomyces endolithicus]KAK0314607.1 hypothetical protein LTR01_001431 [Friedmanniomyces endolithicus]KAK0830853.1 hypothetical protein LTR73_003240 [Friedmanniomyces endolithicus]KAK0927783.1 hypothetical protein LTR57_003026 [Friedmanniomyces endolithicus]KAK0999407.1 hypothetical protein LTR54_009152 [Friedmanniomyces endolithicus]